MDGYKNVDLSQLCSMTKNILTRRNALRWFSHMDKMDDERST